MKLTKTKQDFIRLRAEGYSFRKIEAEIGVSKSTCSKWNKELAEKVNELKRDNLTDLYNSYGMTRAARIENIGAVRNKLRAAVDNMDLGAVPPAKLLELYLKYSDALKEEYAPPREPIPFTGESSLTELLAAAADIYNRVRGGELDAAQAKQEIDALSNVLKAYDVIELQKKINELEEILELREKTDDITTA